MVTEIMSTGLKEATKQARAAWLCKATLVNETLPRDQLHGLCRLLLDHRDALIKNLCEGQFEQHPAALFRPVSLTRSTTESERSDVFWEQELAILMEDLYALILYLNSAKAPRYTRRTKHDTFELVAQPKGLCLVLSDPDWLLRSALAAIAGAIAARNTVILGVTKPSKTFELLQCNIPQYLDSFTVHFVQCNPRSISHGLYDDICVIGTEASICFEENTVQKGLYSVSEASACTVLRNYPDVTYRCVDHSIDVGFIDETQSPNASMYVESISRHLGILSGIFIPQQHQKIALDAIGGLDRHQQSKGGSSRKLSPGCTRISPSVSGIDLSQCATSTDLIGLLDRAQQNHETILFWTTSREHVLDALGRISRTLNQVALLSRPPKKIETYLINWLRSSKVSTGAFRRDIPEGEWISVVQIRDINIIV